MPGPSILHVIPSVAPRYGGPSAAVVGMCRATRAAGLDVLVATTDADGDGRLDVPLGTVTSYDGVPAIFFRRQATESFKWSAPLGAWLRQRAREFDVVHAHAVFSHAPIAAARACLAAGVPYVVRPLGTLDPWSVRRKAWQKRAVLRLGAGEALRGAAAMHYTTAEEQRLVEAAFPGLPRGVVIPVGIDARCFDAPSTKPPDPYALVLSRIDPKKRIEWVIDAWHRMAAEPAAGRWKLVIAGDGDPAYVDRLRRAADAGPAASRISFRGWVAGDAKQTLLGGASLFVVTSSQENFGVAMVEAMAAGAPPLVTPGINLAHEIEAAGAGWRIADTPEALRGGLAAAIADEPGRQARGRRASAFADQFRWPAVGRQLITLYEGLVSARAGRLATVPHAVATTAH